MNTDRPILLVGFGYVAEAVAAAVPSGRRILATTRNPETMARLAALGIEPVLIRDITRAILDEHVQGADVVVTFPPDRHSDAILAPQCGAAHRVVYVSSTAVYGDTPGRIDDATPIRPSDETGCRRAAAESAWRAIGAGTLRAPGIYGPWRGLHRLLITGAYRLPGDGSGVVSRIHVADLATLILASLERDAERRTFVVGDACPAPQLEVVTWLCARLGLPMPPSVALEDAPRSLRRNRAVDATEALASLGVQLQYPSYREGFPACLADEGRC